MVRTQVYLSEAQHRALRQAARRDGISMTALLRRMVERELLGGAKQPGLPKNDIMAIVGLGRRRPE